jgi:hypothetical protein
MTFHRMARRFLPEAMILLSASMALGQDPGSIGALVRSPAGAEAVAESYGLGPQDHWVSVLEFTGGSGPTNPQLTWEGTTFPYYRHDAESGVALYAPVRLPAGASVTAMQCFFKNDVGILGTTAGVSLLRAWHDLSTNAPGFMAVATVASTNVIGYQQPSVSFAETIRYLDGNRRNMYILEASFLRLPEQGFHSLAGCNLTWRRQVTPAPASATFSDVPVNHQQFRFVEALAAAGITSGCTPPPSPNYCPDSPITRGQMAVFLAAALGLHFPN